MAFDFPASPTNGQTFTPPGGPSYVWDGVGWVTSDSPVGVPSPFKRTVFSASTSAFQYDPSTLMADIEVQGAGGGGGGTTNSGAGLARAGGGGGGGGYTKKLIQIDATVRAATKTITVGAAGSGGNAVGTTGGNSSYADGTNTISGLGGSPGTGGAVSTTVSFAAGGQGGNWSNGDFGVTGQPGINGSSYGTSIIEVAANAAAWGGNGGSAFLGGGGLGAGTGNASSNASGAGSGGTTGGGGGGGYTVNAAGSAAQGGDGGAGRVIITEYR